MHVTLVGQYDPFNPNIGGIEIHIGELQSQLKKIGVETLLIGWTTSKIYKKSFVPIIKGKRLSGTRFFFQLLLKAPFFRIPKDSIIHCHRPDHILPFVFRKNRVLCTLHGAHIKNVRLKWGRLPQFIYGIIQYIAFRRANAIISVSHRKKDFFLASYPFIQKKIHVISTGNSEDFLPQDQASERRKWGIEVGKKVILYAGRLEKEKNVDRIICGIRATPYHLIIAGTGREESNLRMLAADCGRIKFLGLVPHMEMPSLINSADLTLLLSTHEGMPTIAIESMACGVPVLATDVGDLDRLVINGRTGYITDMDNFLQNLEKCLSLDKKLAQESCVRMARSYAWKRKIKEVISVYETLKK